MTINLNEQDVREALEAANVWAELSDMEAECQAMDEMLVESVTINRQSYLDMEV